MSMTDPQPRPSGAQIDPGVEHMATAHAGALLERLAGSGLIERGAVSVISVESIRARASDRWARKRDDVWAYVERKCDEHLSFHDMRRRISETEFLIALTTEQGVAAQAVCLKILKEVLDFFLGAAEPGDIRLRAVTAIDGETITTADVDLAKLAGARGGETETPSPTVADPAETRRRSPVSFVTASGERVRIDFAIERVLNMGHQTTSALRVQPTVRLIATGAVIPIRAFPKLADDDIAFIDRSTLEFGSLYLPKDVQSDPPVILPASFRTMGGRKGRGALIGVPGVTTVQIKQGVMIELIDIDLGTPTARLIEVTNLVSQLCRGVLARIWPTRGALDPIRGVRLQGITFDSRELCLDDARLAALLRQVALLARGKAPALIAQGLQTSSWLGRSRDCGFTHASMIAPPLPESQAEAA